MSTKPKKIGKLEDLSPDAENANEGTLRGSQILAHSIDRFGAGRSILADRDGVVIAGNKTLEAAVDRGLKAIVVKSDGQKLVVVQRTDLDLKTNPEARELAYLDNRSSELGLAWKPAQIEEDLRKGIDFGAMFTAAELELTLKVDTPEGWTGPTREPSLVTQVPFDTMDQHNQWLAFLEAVDKRYEGGTISSKVLRWVEDITPALMADIEAAANTPAEA